MLERIANERFDVLVVGGGATGLGCAVDASSRGYRTALVEAGDFACGTSSRSTKLIHGGVRYLARGNVHLVREALHERTLLRRNAPHLVGDLTFLTPAYRWFDVAFYSSGLRLYDLLAGRSDDFGRSGYVSRAAARARLPWLRERRLRGAIAYHDGQFDDARLAIALARTASHHGAALANYVRCIGFGARAGSDGERTARVRDEESGTEFIVRAGAIVNACGVFADDVRRMDDPAAVPMLSLSRGTHIVIAPHALPGTDALLIPKTEDGRVIFAIPWHGHTVIGTTDVPVTHAQTGPAATQAEIAYLLATFAPYTDVRIDEGSITATFAGLRPLIERSATARTARLSREHVVEVSSSGMVTIAGGKWTTYRKMAQDAIDAAIGASGLPHAECATESLPLFDDPSAEIAALIDARPQLGAPLCEGFPYSLADVVQAFENEMARTVDDVLARRTRLAFLDTRAAAVAAQIVGTLQPTGN